MLLLQLHCCLWLLVLASANSPYHQSNCAGNREAIVHLFEWKWADVAAECERFLGPMGFCGVQVSPPTEHALIYQDERPWWERYQPVSYILTSRSGTEAEFADMVRRCNDVDVRIYVDAIINHMAGAGREGYGSAGSYFNSDDWHFPGVPFEEENFNDCSNCPECCCINAWNDHTAVRDCQLLGLLDLRQSIPDTADKIVSLLNKCIDYGVAGFRVDAAKHMWPADLQDLWDRTNDLPTEYFPPNSRPFFALEVIDMNQQGEVNVHEYKHLGRVTEFRYCTKVKEATGALWDIPGLYDPGWGMLDYGDAFVFVDNHDNQRGHGAGSDVITYKSPREYQIAQAITLGWDYGYPRIMSSFYFDDSEAGPPCDEDYNTNDVIINPDGSCGNGWVCEHRWKSIAGMASFSKATSGEPALDFWSEGNQAAWRRGNKGFVAISNHNYLDQTFNTGLPAGEYCNVIEGPATETGCEGRVVTVDGSGNARVLIDNEDAPIFAIHVEAMFGTGTPTPTPGPTTTTTTSATTTTTAATTDPATPTDPPTGSTVPTDPPTTTEPGEEDWRRTIIYMHAATQPGQDIFFRGGIDAGQRPGCTEDPETDPCAISIEHNPLGSDEHYAKYNAWKVGDTKLNWYGEQEGQGDYEGTPAGGTPSAWTTSDSSHPGFQEDNRWGDNYWKVDLEMNCAETESGWFELKGFVYGVGWEPDVQSAATCTGTAGGSPPYISTGNHMVRCGYFNVISWNDGSCVVDDL